MIIEFSAHAVSNNGGFFMRVLGLLLMCLSLPALAGRSLTAQIYDLDYGRKPGDEILVFLSSGLVAKIPKGKEAMLDQMLTLKSSQKSWYKLTLDDDRYITKFKLSDYQGPNFDPAKVQSTDKMLSQYVLTTIANMDVAQKYHREARHSPKDSQCFNRAHIWSYEWWKKHSLRSGKMLIYFTRNYIRRYNFEWWWHIAPYVHIMHEGKVVERVMDVKYTNGPRTIRQWTDIFMRNDAPCKTITKYSDYADYPYTGDCYLQRANMYYYQAADLQMMEAWGYNKTNWIMDEVKGAYLEAFGIHL